jgi:hypothetical protein
MTLRFAAHMAVITQRTLPFLSSFRFARSTPANDVARSQPEKSTSKRKSRPLAPRASLAELELQRSWTCAVYPITLFVMDKPNHHDVDVILKLYELRREDRMRKARSWLFGYKASNAAEHQAACPPGSDQEAYYRMVTSYWDMAASFVTSGAVNKDLFLQSAGELLFVWEKTKATIADTRKAMANPGYLSNLENVAQALIENMNKANPRAYGIFSDRVLGVGA